MSDKLTTEQIEAIRARLNRAVEHEALYNSDGFAESRELIAFQYDAVDMVAALLAALDAAQAENARLLQRVAELESAAHPRYFDTDEYYDMDAANE